MQPEFAVRDPAAWRSLVRDHGWATLITAQSTGGLVVSHLPVIVDEESEELAVLGHLARTDAAEHELGEHDVVLIGRARTGTSPRTGTPTARTCRPGTSWCCMSSADPECSGREETYRVLDATVDHLESGMAQPWQLAEVADYAHHIAGRNDRLPAGPAAGGRARPSCTRTSPSRRRSGRRASWRRWARR